MIKRFGIISHLFAKKKRAGYPALKVYQKSLMLFVRLLFRTVALGSESSLMIRARAGFTFKAAAATRESISGILTLVKSSLEKPAVLASLKRKEYIEYGTVVPIFADHLEDVDADTFQ
jgi:hypothetical protein